MKPWIKVASALVLIACFAPSLESLGRDEPYAHMGAANIVFAGVRSSSYGITPFPAPRDWETAATAMTGYFQASAPALLWIVGVMHRERDCRLEFPGDGHRGDHILFLERDIHEAYLDHFDLAGIKVFLQVEPGHADVPTLIDLVLRRYRQHTCVVGFGIDVEWHREADRPGRGIGITDAQAKAWEERVKSHDPEYRLFLKHWNPRWMPPHFRGDIIFVNDGQMFRNLDHLIKEFVESWADRFKPNTVFFQIGYPRDRPLWSRLPYPPRHIGLTIARSVTQQCGIFWVDFTLREVLPVSGQDRP